MILPLLVLSCSLTINNGAISGSCGEIVTPAPAPTPAPTPVPPAGIFSLLKIGGSNNIFEGFDGQVLIFELPKMWNDGNPVTEAQIQFGTRPFRNFGGEEYEAAFSPIPGDFTYYQTHPHCGKKDTFANFQLAWKTTTEIVNACQTDDRRWYLNYRVVGCPVARVCGNDVYVSK